MINPKNNDVNNDQNNDVTIVGTDFFTDSESFLNELTDDELEQVRGGNHDDVIRPNSTVRLEVSQLIPDVQVDGRFVCGFV